MNVNENEMIRKIIMIVCLLLYYLWKRYHYKYIKQHQKYNLFLEWASMAYIAITGIVVCIVIEVLGNFPTIYIVLPICVGLLYLLRQYDESYIGFYYLLKGIYYFLLAIYSIWQYYSQTENLTELAIGFTIALAIFESITAIWDGIIKIKTHN